jgi:hypothetical protein
MAVPIKIAQSAALLSALTAVLREFFDQTVIAKAHDYEASQRRGSNIKSQALVKFHTDRAADDS